MALSKNARGVSRAPVNNNAISYWRHMEKALASGSRLVLQHNPSSAVADPILCSNTNCPTKTITSPLRFCIDRQSQLDPDVFWMPSDGLVKTAHLKNLAKNEIAVLRGMGTEGEEYICIPCFERGACEGREHWRKLAQNPLVGVSQHLEIEERKLENHEEDVVVPEEVVGYFCAFKGYILKQWDQGKFSGTKYIHLPEDVNHTGTRYEGKDKFSVYLSKKDRDRATEIKEEGPGLLVKDLEKKSLTEILETAMEAANGSDDSAVQGGASDDLESSEDDSAVQKRLPKSKKMKEILGAKHPRGHYEKELSGLFKLKRTRNLAPVAMSPTPEPLTADYANVAASKSKKAGKARAKPAAVKKAGVAKKTAKKNKAGPKPCRKGGRSAPPPAPSAAGPTTAKLSAAERREKLLAANRAHLAATVTGAPASAAAVTPLATANQRPQLAATEPASPATALDNNPVAATPAPAPPASRRGKQRATSKPASHSAATAHASAPTTPAGPKTRSRTAGAHQTGRSALAATTRSRPKKRVTFALDAHPAPAALPKKRSQPAAGGPKVQGPRSKKAKTAGAKTDEDLINEYLGNV